MVVAHDDGRVEHIPNARFEPSYQPGTRWPVHGTLTLPDGTRIEVAPGPRFFMTGIGYMDPEWTHGINKGPLAVGYDEIDCTTVAYAPPHIYTQAFATVTMTLPDGTTQHGHAAYEALSMGPHARLGFTAMHDGA